MQARSVMWSPDCGYLAVLGSGEQGLLQLWAVAPDSTTLTLLHNFHDCPTHCMLWHPTVGMDGTMLLARYVHVCALHACTCTCCMHTCEYYSEFSQMMCPFKHKKVCLLTSLHCVVVVEMELFTCG